MLPTLRTGCRMTSAGRQWLRVWGAIVARQALPFHTVRRSGGRPAGRAAGMKATFAGRCVRNL